MMTQELFTLVDTYAYFANVGPVARAKAIREIELANNATVVGLGCFFQEETHWFIPYKVVSFIATKFAAEEIRRAGVDVVRDMKQDNLWHAIVTE